MNVFQETNLHDAEIVNFNISPKRRVINTAKSELGKVAKSIVETNIKNAREVIPQPLEKFIKYTYFGLPLDFLHLEIILLSAILCYTFEKKNFFVPTSFYEKSQGI